uniref:Uncharacterized protein n=1 Tax=Strigamia maritima TaxID=126957 RepID=T1J1B8_STRMM
MAWILNSDRRNGMNQLAKELKIKSKSKDPAVRQFVKKKIIPHLPEIIKELILKLKENPLTGKSAYILWCILVGINPNMTMLTFLLDLILNFVNTADLKAKNDSGDQMSVKEIVDYMAPEILAVGDQLDHSKDEETSVNKFPTPLTLKLKAKL